MMTGLGIDFGPPEEQVQRPVQHRPALPQMNSAPSAPTSSRKPVPLPHNLPKRHTATGSQGQSSNAQLPTPRRRVRIASGQPGVMGLGITQAPEHLEEDGHYDFSSPEAGYTGRSSFSGATARSSTGTYYNGYDSSVPSPPSDYGASPSSETSPADLYPTAAQRSRMLRKRASQPALGYNEAESPVHTMSKSVSTHDLGTAAAAVTTRPGKAVEPLSHRKTQSVGANTFAKQKAPSALAASISAPSSPRQSDKKAQSAGSASPSKIKLALLEPEAPLTPREDGMVSDGFGGYKRPDAPSGGSSSSSTETVTSPEAENDASQQLRDEPSPSDVSQMPASQSRRALPQVPTTAPLQFRPRGERTKTEPPTVVQAIAAERRSIPSARSQSFDGHMHQSAQQADVAEARPALYDTRSSFCVGEIISPSNVYVNGAVEDWQPEEQAEESFGQTDYGHFDPRFVQQPYESFDAVETRPARQARTYSETPAASLDPQVESYSDVDPVMADRGTNVQFIASSSEAMPMPSNAPRKPLPSPTSDLDSRAASPIKGSHLMGAIQAAPEASSPEQKKSRVDIDLLLESELVVEGGNLRGRLMVNIGKDKKGRGELLLAYPKVRVVGFEELLDDETRHIFYHHSTIVDGDTQPGGSQPYVLHGSPCLSSPGFEGHEPLPCFASQPDEEGYSVGREGSHSIPFSLEMPIGKGAKGSYRGKKALVRYIVIGSVKLKSSDGSNRSIAHFYRHVDLLPYINPAVVLASAPRPIQATTERNRISLTASLHRPTWVAGQRVYVNVAVRNDTSRRIKNVTLSLVRTVTIYQPRPELRAHGSTTEGFDPEACEAIVSRKRVAEEVLGVAQDASPDGSASQSWWTGVQPNSHLEFAHHLNIPVEALSIARSRHVEISYEARVSVGSSSHADVIIDLPLRVVNFTSLDPPPLKSISGKSLSSISVARSWFASSPLSNRGAMSPDEAPMIQKVRAAEALRSPGQVQIGQGQPHLPSGPPNRLLALSQRAAERNGHLQPNGHLQAPEASGGRSIQHQKSLDFINHAIKSATARKNSSQQTSTENLPLGLGIDIDAANSLQRDLDEDRTPTSTTSSTFTTSQASFATANSRRRSSGHRHYENIDVPAPSFGFPFLQLPVVSVDDGDAFDSDDEGEDAGNRTLGLNQDSVDEVDMVVESTHRRDQSERFNADEEESFDPDVSVETVRDGDDSQDAVVGYTGRNETVSQHGCPAIKVESPERSILGQDRGQAVGRRVLHPTLATLPLTTSSAVATLKKSSGNLRARVAVTPAEKRAAVVVEPAAAASSPTAKVLPLSRDHTSPTKAALKTKSSFTFATSDAPLRQNKGPRPISASLKDAPRAKAAAAQFADAVSEESPRDARTVKSPTKARPTSKQPPLVNVPAPVAAPTVKTSSRLSPRKSVAVSRELSSSSESDSAQEALTPEALHAEADMGAADDYFTISKQSHTQKSVASAALLAQCTPPRVRREATAEPAIATRVSPATPTRTMRHSASVASFTLEKERLTRGHSSQNLRAAAAAAAGGAGTAVVPSVRNKIAQLESRQQALRQFIKPASADSTPVKGESGTGSAALAPRRGSALLVPASESRLTARSRGSNSSLRASFSAATGLSASSPSSSPTAHATSAGSSGRLIKRVSALSLLQSSEADLDLAQDNDDEDDEIGGQWLGRRGSMDSLASFKAPMLRGLGA
ncbi:hypothetical protein BCV69DRAFT_313177 [Microstroma glucosiphilum]|uniref:Arrestin C-terminal-like domain-containing protein n=1 Tax=Pseudomicrostroma glucosiphilum TaxID=1684307 RepID=A0A316U469_9BASI|nr:hypothetical protein BCV69DRAFT_313177 [Pseudomicrostroma glucosiphilum]PWN19970.1 hypothetical protein BCV69DRAFT_313177 [Pseudomicrostroma glucosiphilum]